MQKYLSKVNLEFSFNKKKNLVFFLNRICYNSTQGRNQDFAKGGLKI